MKRFNKAWHEAHVMPKHATLEQRISWHLAHQENCGCRPMPQKLQMELNKRNAKAEAHE